MIKEEIIDFFDKCAPTWDANTIKNDDVIETILRNGGVKTGSDVLDVACGTGVLFPFYLKFDVNSVLGVDFSPLMIENANKKVHDKRIEVLCADIESVHLRRSFDCCMVYNAFPHFSDPANLIKVLAGNLKVGGILSIAHGMSREKINGHHEGSANKVSLGLMSNDELVTLFRPYFDISCAVSNGDMYQVCGIKKKL